jgi:hypothetical protein
MSRFIVGDPLAYRYRPEGDYGEGGKGDELLKACFHCAERRFTEIMDSMMRSWHSGIPTRMRFYSYPCFQQVLDQMAAYALTDYHLHDNTITAGVDWIQRIDYPCLMLPTGNEIVHYFEGIMTFYYRNEPIVSNIYEGDKPNILTVLAECIKQGRADPLLLDNIDDASAEKEPLETSDNSLEDSEGPEDSPSGEESSEEREESLKVWEYVPSPEVANQEKQLSKMRAHFDDEQNAQISREYTRGFAEAQELFKKPTVNREDE